MSEQMESDDFDLTEVSKPKSDQLNSDDLIGGPRTIKIRAVKRGNAEQRMSIYYEGDGGKPYKPCLSMIRVILFAWGSSAKAAVGKSLTLYRDPTAKWSGKEVGGIRISHMSHIKQDFALALTETKGKRGTITVKRLMVDESRAVAPDEKPPEPEKPPGDIEQARVTIGGADSQTIDVLLPSFRAFTWTKDENAELRELAAAARKRSPPKPRAENEEAAE